MGGYELHDQLSEQFFRPAALPGRFVDDIEYSELLTAVERVMHKIERPLMVHF